MTSRPIAYLTKVGPIEKHQGESLAMYVAFAVDADVVAIGLESPPNDAAGLRKLVKELPGHETFCALELAQVGATLGIEPRDLPPLIAAARAGTAYLTAFPKQVSMGEESPAELADACARYLEAAPWPKLASDVLFGMHATVIDHEKGQNYELDLRSRIGEVDHSEGVTFELSDDGAFGDIVLPDLGDRSPLYLSVTLAEEPRFVADAVGAAFGSRFCPRITYTLGSRVHTPDAGLALLLAASVRAATSYVKENIGSGRASVGPFEVIVRGEFQKPIEHPDLPPRDTPTGRRARARLVAQVTAAHMPMPYYDGYVCVVVDPNPDDELARRVWAVTEGIKLSVDKKKLGKEFARIYDETVDFEGYRGRWMPVLALVQRLAKELTAQDTELLLGDLPPAALRVLLIADGKLEAFCTDFEPLYTKELAQQIAERRRAEAVIEEELRLAAKRPPAPPPPPVEGTWRDGRGYLPDPLPAGWRIGERLESGGLQVEAGKVVCDIGAHRRDGRRWVNLIFRPDASGRQVTYDDARAVFERLVGCGRFTEMEVKRGGEIMPTLGMRFFSAPIAKVRPQAASPVKRDEVWAEAVIERAKPCIREVLAMARDSGKPLNEFCVIIGEGPAADGLPDGVVLTRKHVKEMFAKKENDPFDIRGRFEEPRLPNEFAIFVKGEDGIEEIPIFQKVERGAVGEA